MSQDEDSSSLVVAASSAIVSTLSPEVQRKVDRNKEAPRAAPTLRAYKADWLRFLKWCAKEGHVPFPASEDVIVAHLLDLSQTMSVGTVSRTYASIRAIHDLKKEPLQRLFGVTNTLKRIKRERASRWVPVVVKKKAFEAEQVIAACAKLPDTLTGKRDRVALLLGFAIAQRRAEIAAVQVANLEFVKDGLQVWIPRSKTDQEGKGHTAPVHREGGPGCPVAAVEDWLSASGIKDGALIRRIHKSGGVDPRGLSGDGVAQLVKAAARSLGLDPKDYGGHSLRHGFITSAAKAGKDLDAIMSTTGHVRVETVRGYIDESTKMQRAAGKGLLATPKSIADHLDPELLFYKGSQAVTLGWVRKQVRLLESRGMTHEQALEALVRVGVTKDGRSIEATDI